MKRLLPAPLLRRVPARRLSAHLARTGGHETALQALFGPEGMDCRAHAGRHDIRLVVVAFTNRSGSNLLVDYLRQAGRCGGGGEEFNADIVADQCRSWQIGTLPDYLDRLRARFAPGPHKALAVKASADQLAMLLRHGAPQMFSETIVLHVLRHDLLAQAVSYMIALQTGQWTSQHETAGTEPEFRPEVIDRALLEFNTANLAIRSLAELAGLRRWDLAYEQMLNDPARNVARVLRAAGLAGPHWQPRPPGITRQANDRNAAFAARYLDWMRDEAGLG